MEWNVASCARHDLTKHVITAAERFGGEITIKVVLVVIISVAWHPTSMQDQTTSGRFLICIFGPRSAALVE